MEETTQRVNFNLANELATNLQHTLDRTDDQEEIQKEINYYKGINPGIDIYLLNGQGMIKRSFFGDAEVDDEVQMATIDVSPLNDFIASESDIYVRGSDPRNPSNKKPFSAANVNIMGEEGCYLYIILNGEEYEQVANIVGDSYILKSSLLGLLLIVLSTGGIGLILFRNLTKRLNSMQNVVVAFEQGQLEKRIHVESEDEIGTLGNSFNQMADTIVANMEEIKKSDMYRRELVANVSHDLRSPLASIQGYLETIQIKEETLSAEDRNRYFDIVLNNTRKLNNLVAELFELSKLDAQDVKPTLEKVSIAELVQDLVYQFQPQAENKQIKLEAIIPDDPLNFVYADIALMERAVGNLIDNAIKHTPSNGTVSIIPNNEKENSVSVAISDTGQGIGEEDLKRIFDRFYQVDKSRTTGSGAGLGLSITQKILELHGSKLSVESALNKGTTFSFVLGTSPVTAAL